MKKTKKQKAYEEKHWMRYNYLNKPHMVKRISRKPAKRFKLLKLKRIVNKMVWENQNVPLFSGRCWVSSRGISMSFPNRKVRINTSRL